MPTDPPGHDPEALREVRSLVARSTAGMAPVRPLRAPEPIVVRAGRRGGLPFDGLTTDLHLGCLPITQVCYGSCFAARAAFGAGFDFGVRVRNHLDADVLRADLAALPAGQRFLRNGWNSDASWDWRGARELADLVRESGRCTVFVTKHFHPVPPDVLAGLVAAGAELRVSVSALDTPGQLRQRLGGLLAYRDAGGVAVPVVMSSRYADGRLGRRQDALVDWIAGHDLPGAENSLRFPPRLSVAALLDHDRVGVLDGSGDLWAGRLYGDRLPVPTITAVPGDYPGLPWRHLSEVDRDLLASWAVDPVRTHEEVAAGGGLAKPEQCGVSRAWSADT
ncbi:hypothetical protein [Actinosynnema pretiosum]|uniref:Radical SAM protein n=1 Tax=Actinosynnema pretiosum TaxID=42197 RepID=A0A290ZA21_9PSEU|nr:hypothetical protein [Actinosynnema pretiosum]ATE55823.1 hypothetical protein CNX65_23180 [Actinosynnema pretiosum]